MIVSLPACMLCTGCPSDSTSSTRFCAWSSKLCTMMSLSTLWMCCGITIQRDSSDRQARISLSSLCRTTAVATVHLPYSGTSSLEPSSTVTDRLSLSPALQQRTKDSFDSVQDHIWQSLTETHRLLKRFVLFFFNCTLVNLLVSSSRGLVLLR